MTMGVILMVWQMVLFTRDPCDGCQHINFYAFGPDFKENLIISEERELIDIPATIAELLNFRIPNSNGNIMTELFK